MDSDDDLRAAMARKLAELGGVGESADAVWADLKGERAAQAGASPGLPQPLEIPEITDMFTGIDTPMHTVTPGPMLVEPKPKSKNVEPIWPTGYVVGQQLQLFG